MTRIAPPGLMSDGINILHPSQAQATLESRARRVRPSGWAFDPVTPALAPEKASAAKPGARAWSCVLGETNTWPSIPLLVVETHGRLGKPALALLDPTGRGASEASLGASSPRQFVDGVLQQVGAVLNKYNCRMETSAVEVPSCCATRAATGVALALPPRARFRTGCDASSHQA